MSASTASERVGASRRRRWGGGVVGGLVGGVAMGIVLQLAGLMPLIGAIVGARTAVGGWAVHLAISVLFALMFVWVVSLPFVADDFTNTFGGTVGAGVVYGALLEVVSGGVVLPLVVMSIGEEELPLPLLPIPGVVEVLTLPIVVGIGHLMYGALLGVVYAFFQYGQTLPEH